MSEVPQMRSSISRILTAIVIAFLLAACSGGADLGTLVRQITGTPASTPAATSTTATTDDAATLAVKDTIVRANAAQAKAFNTGDATLMKDTATSDFYTQLVGINRDLASGGVTQIDIVSTDCQSVSVTGSSATATT